MNVKKNFISLLVFLGCFQVSIHANEQSLRLLTLPEWGTLNTESPFFLPESFSGKPSENLTQVAEFGLGLKGVRLNGMVKGIFAPGNKPEYDGRLNELYWDFGLLGQDWTVGKKVLSWGVGFAFRPLDVIQRQNKRTLFPLASEGVPVLAMQRFGETSALTLVYANPGRGTDTQPAPRRDESLALKWFDSVGGADLHGVARLSERQNFELGGGFFHVFSDALEWHGSLLYTKKYQKQINSLTQGGTSLLSVENPVLPASYTGGWRGLAGFGWTGPGKTSIMAEYWRDSLAYSKEEWRDLIALTRAQKSLLGTGVPDEAVYGNIAYNMVYFEPSSLNQENIFLRFGYDKAPLNSALELLYAPEDKGWVFTLTQGYASGPYRLKGIYRQYGGEAFSVFSLLPVSSVLLLAFELNF